MGWVLSGKEEIMARKSGLSVSNKKASGTASSSKRVSGTSSAKGKASKSTGKPLTKQGTQKQIGKSTGCLLPILSVFVLFLTLLK